MKVTYDGLANAAYLYLREIAPGEIEFSQEVEIEEVEGTINVDFDAEGRLIGIEFLNARAQLPTEVKEEAERIA